MSFKLLTKHFLEFLRLQGGCTGSSESTLVKMPHCVKSGRGSFITKFLHGDERETIRQTGNF